MPENVHKREPVVSGTGASPAHQLNVMNEPTAATTLIDGSLEQSGKDRLFRRAWRGGSLRLTISFKTFSIVVGLLVLMSAAALLSLRMTQTVDNQLDIIDENYFPAYVSLAQANIHSVEQSAFVRRLLLRLTESPRDENRIV